MFSNPWRSTLGIAFALCLMTSPRCDASSEGASLKVQPLSKIDIDLLDDISRRSFRYFWEQTSPRTGLVFDRAIDMGPGDAPGDQSHVA